MKVLVTGAGGFIGGQIVKRLVDQGYEVHLVGSPNTRYTEEIRDKALSVNALDVSNLSEVQKLDEIEKVDVLIHTAGIAHRFGGVDDKEYFKVNVVGTKNIVEFAVSKGATHIIHFSSVLVYGKNDLSDPISETREPDPSDAYGKSKLNAEHAVAEICEEKDINLTILRPCPVIGEGSKGNFGRLIRAVSKGRFLKIGNGQNKKSFIYVDDIADACLMLIEQKKPGTEVFNLAGNAVTTDEMIDALSAELDKKLLPVRLPPSFLRLGLGLLKYTPMRTKAGSVSGSLDTWLSNDVYSTKLLRERYDFSPKTHTLDAVKKEAEFYRKNLK